MEDLFARAEEVVSRYFRDRDHDPSRGTIEIFGERYVLVRAASLSVEFFALVQSLFGASREREANDFARNILFDLAHAVGRSDARNFHAKMNLVDPIARLSAGPVHFAHSGWAFVDIFPESQAVPNQDYCLVYDHPYSFESDAWLEAGRQTDFPVCIMNAGYSSGWCEESFGVTLVASEILCRARGDEACRFVMAHPSRIEGFVERYRSSSPDLAPRMAGYSIPDFFARKRMEDELRRSHDELELRVRQRTAELEASQRRLLQAQKLEALGRLAGGVAHDFNNILGVIMAQVELLRRRLPPDDPLRAESDVIRAAARRAADLTRQLLAFGRGQVMRRERVDLDQTVERLSTTLIPLIGEDIELTVEPIGESALVEVEAGQIEQVLMNLVVNARDAMPDGGRLDMAVAAAELRSARPVTTGELAPGEYLRLSVADNGTGMSEDTQSRAFDPFFTTKPDHQGTGLGLSIVYGIVQQIGGGVVVDSALGRGTRIDVYLPRSHRAPGESDDPANRDQAPAPSPGPSGGETVLLVEDQIQLRASIEHILMDDGYRVLAAADGDSALELLASHPDVDLVLTDLVMPRMDGRELARRVRKGWPDARILFMSGWDPGAAPDRPLDGPILAKPFTPDELAVAVRDALNWSGRAS